jgi:hypothetical protein
VEERIPIVPSRESLLLIPWQAVEVIITEDKTIDEIRQKLKEPEIN